MKLSVHLLLEKRNRKTSIQFEKQKKNSIYSGFVQSMCDSVITSFVQRFFLLLLLFISFGLLLFAHSKFRSFFNHHVDFSRFFFWCSVRCLYYWSNGRARSVTCTWIKVYWILFCCMADIFSLLVFAPIFFSVQIVNVYIFVKKNEQNVICFEYWLKNIKLQPIAYKYFVRILLL